ncbi:MAG: chromosomal replication initiator protein DnaA [Clostridia bacterium]|nr:chromosomal replication initiator protein DnaA [Clostridia bacterium]
MNINSIWNATLNSLKTQVSSLSYDLWINTLEPIDVIDGVLYLSTTSANAKNRVLSLHGEQIKQSVKALTDEIKDFVVLDPYEKDEYFEKLKFEQERSLAQSQKVNNFNKKYTFDNFVVGNSNKYVFAAAVGVAEHPGKINPLFIYGGTGLGKTHLLHAIGNYLEEHNPELNVLYVTCEKFVNDYIESMKNGGNHYNSKFREKYRNVDVLMVDDIQIISKHTGTQEEFFHTFNDLYQNNKQIIIVSDRPPKEIPTLQERLVSRFSMGFIQDIQTPDFETRVAILQKKAENEKYIVNKDVINYIAENFDTNIRELEGILGKVHFYACLHMKEVADLEDVMESLKDHVTSTKQNLTTDRIIDCVCRYFNVSRTEILGKKKNKEIVEPRQICMYIIVEMLALPLTSVGQIFGGKDHTTVIHAREKVADLIKNNNRIKIAVEDIKSMASRQ